MKWKITVSSLLASVLLAACGAGGRPPEMAGEKPYEQVANLISLAEYLPEDIHANYTEDGQTRLRMAFPDRNHRDIALKQIGRHVPDLTFETVAGDLALRDLAGERVIINLTSTSASVTAEMAPELAQHIADTHVRVIHFYPNDTEEAIAAFHDENGLAFDTKNIVAGNGSEEAQNAVAELGTTYVPTLLYVDETGTISYLSVGFRDAILLQDNYDAAFEQQKLYTYLSGYESESAEDASE